MFNAKPSPPHAAAEINFTTDYETFRCHSTGHFRKAQEEIINSNFIEQLE